LQTLQQARKPITLSLKIPPVSLVILAPQSSTKIDQSRMRDQLKEAALML
jgi:hypothetical protein